MSEHVIDAGPHGFSSFAVGGNAAEADLSTELFVSSPRAGRSVVAAPADEPAYFGVQSTVGWKHVRFSTSVYIDQRPARGVAVAQLAFGDIEPNAHDFVVIAMPARAALAESWLDGSGARTDRNVELARTIPEDKWTRVAIEVALEAPRLFRVTLDGSEVASGVLAYPGPEAPRLVRASAGILIADGVERGPVFVDDVLVERLP